MQPTNNNTTNFSSLNGTENIQEQQADLTEATLPTRVISVPPYKYGVSIEDNIATHSGTLSFVPIYSDYSAAKLSDVELLEHISKFPDDTFMAVYYRSRQPSIIDNLLTSDILHNELSSTQTDLDKVFKLYKETRSNLLLTTISIIANNHKNELTRYAANALISDHDDYPLAQAQKIKYPDMRRNFAENYDIVQWIHDSLTATQNSLKSPRSIEDLNKKIKFVSDDPFISKHVPETHIGTISERFIRAGLRSKQDYLNGTGLRERTPEQALKMLQQNELLKEVIKCTYVYGNGQLPFHGANSPAVQYFQYGRIGTDLCTCVSSDLVSFGKGTTREQAIASATFEFIERYSAILGITTEEIPLLEHSYIEHGLSKYREKNKTLITGTYDELSSDYSMLNPNDFNNTRFFGKIDYSKERLHWTNATTYDNSDSINGKSILVPASQVFLFPRFPEIELGHQSANGLAAGITMNEAKIQGLLEIIERNAISSSFFSEEYCFLLDSNEYPLNKIISSPLKYIGSDFNIQFFDMTQKFGVPAYQAFVRFQDQLITGQGADLNAATAINRALGELLPNVMAYVSSKNASPVCPISKVILTQSVNDLPNYSTGSVNEDLKLLEELLRVNGYTAYYSDLTTIDFGIPVVRCIVPGLDIPTRVTWQQIENLQSFLEK